jgi:hypothetical protein
MSSSGAWPVLRHGGHDALVLKYELQEMSLVLRDRSIKSIHVVHVMDSKME